MAARSNTRSANASDGTLLASDAASSAAQRERRQRILDATLGLASKGGYDAVQMRTVAEHADVALGTLYRYFPSKTHLLVTALGREFHQAHTKLRRTKIPGNTPSQRMLHVLAKTTRRMQRDPHLTEAMTRAFMFADATAATEVDTVSKQIDALFAMAMAGEAEPTEEQLAIARVLSDVWLSVLVAWVTRRASASDVTKRLELTVNLLLR